VIHRRRRRGSGCNQPSRQRWWSAPAFSI
jgi:hypothetical protein